MTLPGWGRKVLLLAIIPVPHDVNEQSGDSIEQESADEGQMSNNDDPQDPVNEVSIDTSEDEPETNDAHVNEPVHRTPPVPASRRSTRIRTMPVKYQSDEYIMSQVKALHRVPQQQVSNTDPEWKNRATFLASLAEKNIFSGLPTHVSRAILQIVLDG